MDFFLAHKYREAVLHYLYAFELYEPSEGLIDLISETLKLSKKKAYTAYEKALNIWNQKEALDPWIETYSHEFSLPRIYKIEKNILRIALFELFFEKLVSLKVVLAEALRLTKKFGSMHTLNFVHAVIQQSYNRSLEDTKE